MPPQSAHTSPSRNVYAHPVYTYVQAHPHAYGDHSARPALHLRLHGNQAGQGLTLTDDDELCERFGIPEERRPEVLKLQHAWARANLPGPGIYAAHLALVWNLLRRSKP